MFELSIINYSNPLYNHVLEIHSMSLAFKLIKTWSQFFYNVLSCKDVQFIIKKV